MNDLLDIRPLEARYIGAAAQCVAALRNDLNGREVTTAIQVGMVIREALGRHDYFGYVGFIDDTAVSFIGLNTRFALYAGGAFGQITELYVRPGMRSRGVGALLLDRARHLARDRGWSHLEVGAPDETRHPATTAFYLREGYRKVGPRLFLEVLR